MLVDHQHKLRLELVGLFSGLFYSLDTFTVDNKSRMVAFTYTCTTPGREGRSVILFEFSWKDLHFPKFWRGGQQPSRSWQAFVDRGRIPPSFRKARNCNFLWQNRCFLQSSRNRQFVVVKGLLWELYKSRMPFGESFRKVGCLSVKALRKQDVFRWKL